MQKKEWKPHAGPQTEAFRYFYVFELLYGGAKGGGKTDWLLFDFLEPALIHNPNYRGIIFRRTFPRLKEIIDRSFKWLLSQAEYNKGDKCWEWKTGAKLYFAHCQYEENKYDYQGHEYHYMGFDQLEEFTESQYEYLKVQARTSDPDITVRIRGTANPGNIGHLWVKKRFIDNRIPMQIYKDELGLTSMFIPAKVHDNPSLVESDPMYVKRLQALPEKERRALLDGDWNVFVGQYFRDWNKVKIVRPYEISADYKRFCSLDYGYKNPLSCGWWAVDYDGNLIRYRELYKELLTYEKFAYEWCELNGDERIDYIVADPAIWGDRSHHRGGLGESGAETITNILKEKLGDKAPVLIKADNSRKTGWNRLREYMEGERITCFDTCVNSIRTIPALIHDQKNVEDIDTDGEDHSGDDWRYGCMSRAGKTDKPETKPAYEPRRNKSLYEADEMLAEVFEE